jgi:low temperature requirement protein LtrA
MSTRFLENKVHTFTIAKIAISFQSIVTILISASLLTILVRETFPVNLLTWLVCCDCMFVAVHLSYRVAYRGPKVPLERNEKVVLAVHSVSSLLALGMTGLLIKQGLWAEFNYILVLLCVWVISLISGVIFFKRKYLK